MKPVYQDFGPCPCGFPGCTMQGTKLSKDGHLTDCECPSHRSQANNAKGRKAEQRRHARLSHKAAPNDEYPNTYALSVTTQDKAGAQIPASFSSFVASEYYRHAMRQAEVKVPVGGDVFPALYLEPESGGAWLVVDIAPRKGKL